MVSPKGIELCGCNRNRDTNHTRRTRRTVSHCACACAGPCFAERSSFPWAVTRLPSSASRWGRTPIDVSPLRQSSCLTSPEGKLIDVVGGSRLVDDLTVYRFRYETGQPLTSSLRYALEPITHRQKIGFLSLACIRSLARKQCAATSARGTAIQQTITSCGHATACSRYCLTWNHTELCYWLANGEVRKQRWPTGFARLHVLQPERRRPEATHVASVRAVEEITCVWERAT